MHIRSREVCDELLSRGPPRVELVDQQEPRSVPPYLSQDGRVLFPDRGLQLNADFITSIVLMASGISGKDADSIILLDPTSLTFLDPRDQNDHVNRLNAHLKRRPNFERPSTSLCFRPVPLRLGPSRADHIEECSTEIFIQEQHLKGVVLWGLRCVIVTIDHHVTSLRPDVLYVLGCITARFSIFSGG